MKKIIMLAFLCLVFTSVKAQPYILHLNNHSCYDVIFTVYVVDANNPPCTYDGETIPISVASNTTLNISLAQLASTYWNVAPSSGNWEWGYATVEVNAGCTTGGTGSSCPFLGILTVGDGTCASSPECYDVPGTCTPSCPVPPTPSRGQAHFHLNATQDVTIDVSNF